MELEMKLLDFNTKYLYKKDSREAWELCQIENGLYRGDCEDYCLSLKKLIPECKDGKLYYCVSKEGMGHCILRVGDKYIDCNIQKFVPKKRFIERGYHSFRKYWRIEVWWYKLSTKLFGRVLFKD